MSDIETDILLIENAKSDIKFFGLLYKKYQKTIFLYVHKQLLDKDLAKDITADCFVKAMKNLDKYEHRNLPFSAWLYRIAINEINSYFKKHKKLKIFSLDDVVLENFSDWSETDCEDQKKVEKLEMALKKLDNSDQNLLNMAFQDNKTYKEIGQIYHTTEQNIKVKMFRIREKLKNWMN